MSSQKLVNDVEGCYSMLLGSRVQKTTPNSEIQHENGWLGGSKSDGKVSWFDVTMEVTKGMKVTDSLKNRFFADLVLIFSALNFHETNPNFMNNQSVCLFIPMSYLQTLYCNIIRSTSII